MSHTMPHVSCMRTCMHVCINCTHDQFASYIPIHGVLFQQIKCGHEAHTQTLAWQKPHGPRDLSILVGKGGTGVVKSRSCDINKPFTSKA